MELLPPEANFSFSGTSTRDAATYSRNVPGPLPDNEFSSTRGVGDGAPGKHEHCFPNLQR